MKTTQIKPVLTLLISLVVIYAYVSLIDILYNFGQGLGHFLNLGF